MKKANVKDQEGNEIELDNFEYEQVVIFSNQLVT